MRRFGYLGLCLIVSIALAMGLGCDSSSSNGDGGGSETPAATMGYTLADLAGKWTLTGVVATATLTFDDQGRLLRYVNVNGLVGPWLGEITVAPDGKLGSVVSYEVFPQIWYIYSFSKLRFKSKYRIGGALFIYGYSPQAGKVGPILSGPAIINRPVPK